MPASRHGSLDESQLREIETLGAAGLGPPGIVAELSLSPNFTESEIQGLAGEETQAADQYRPQTSPHGASIAGGGSTQAANQYKPPASQKLSHFFSSLAKTKGGGGGGGGGGKTKKKGGNGGGGGGEWGTIGKLLPLVGRGDPQYGSQDTGVPYAPGTTENPSIVGGSQGGSSSSDVLLIGGVVAIGAIAFLLLHKHKGETKK